MTVERDLTAMAAGAALLERAMTYALGSLALVSDGLLARPTPCAEWDVRALLTHVRDSLGVLAEAGSGGVIAARSRSGRSNPSDGRAPGGPAVPRESARTLVNAVREGACDLLALLSSFDLPPSIAVGDRTLPAPIVASAGAIEIAVHGWDVACGCGYDRPLPDPLADELIELAPLLVRAHDRPVRFWPARAAPPLASSGDRLLAFLGRDPGAQSHLAPA